MTINSVCVAILYIFFPVFLIVKLGKDRSPSYLNWLSWVLSTGLFIWYMFQVGVWPLTPVGYYFRYLLLALFVFSTIRSYFNVKRGFPSFSWKRMSLLALNLTFCFFPAWLIFSTFISTFQIPEGIHLAFPLRKGRYYIAHGGNNIVTNHHYDVSAQKYALDIVKLNSFGLRSRNLNPRTLENYNILGDTLYSPCNGTIKNLIDDHLDLEPGLMDSEHPAGNYLVIEMDNTDLAVVLAHIMKGSFLVRVGDIVQQGQPLAKVGNSGNTTEPHLHIHAVKNESGDPLFEGEGIPIKFNNRFLIRNDTITVNDSLIKTTQIH